MKLIIAIIRHEKLEDVKIALRDKEIRRLTVLEVKGFGEQLGVTEYYRGQQFSVNLLPKLELQIACNDEFVDTVIGAIESSSKTGEIGDGKVFVLDLHEAVKIRTGERGTSAI